MKKQDDKDREWDKLVREAEQYDEDCGSDYTPVGNDEKTSFNARKKNVHDFIEKLPSFTDMMGGFKNGE